MEGEPVRRRMPNAGMWPRTGSIRFRLTAVATLVVAVVLTVTAIALLTVQRRELTANLDASLEQRADTIAAAFAADPSMALLNTNDEDRAVQLVTVDGRVLAATTNLADAPALPDPLDGQTAQTLRTRDDLPLEDDFYRVLSRRIETDEGAALLHVAENSDDLNETVGNLVMALSMVIPAVVALLAWLMWWLTGSVLKPVENIRGEVDAITNSNSGLRLSVGVRDDEISRLARTMNQMLDRLSDATERQRRFVADAAHELRTPITRIRTTVDVDIAQAAQADPERTNQSIREEAIALQQLIDDLLHLARSDEALVEHKRHYVDLDDIVMDQIRQQRLTHPEVAIDAKKVSAAHLRANPHHLARAVQNLLGNAVRYAETTVVVTLGEYRGHVELTVTDDGPGVPPGQQDHIFERFARADYARSSGDGGTGLGLAITRDIVENHMGTVTYDTAFTDGARFLVRLPIEVQSMNRNGDAND